MSFLVMTSFAWAPVRASRTHHQSGEDRRQSSWSLPSGGPSANRNCLSASCQVPKGIRSTNHTFREPSLACF